MPLTKADFRRMALALPEAAEDAHMGHPDFRVRGRIFATLGWPDEDWGMVKLTPEQQDAFVESTPAVFAPVKGGWGRLGATNVRLHAASARTLGPALLTAWRNVAPRSLATLAGGAKGRSSSGGRKSPSGGRKNRRTTRGS
jgi:hypothetical protein